MKTKAIYHARDDEVYRHPIIDADEWQTRQILGKNPQKYRFLHGYFENTKVKFSICAPEIDVFAFRFYQHISPFPGPDEELAALPKTGEDDFIAFAISHGAAYVECNMGSDAIFSSAEDSSIFYRSNAAVAEFARDKLQELYGEHQIYGYCFGGSGGGYKTMSCIENTSAFDGALPFVIGSPVSLPNCLTTAAHGARLLRHCWDKIIDSLEPGGCGDPYQALNAEEADALREITGMGFPPRCCLFFGSDDDGALPVLTPTVHHLDPDYFTDYWKSPGYLGAVENGSAQRDRICIKTKVKNIYVNDADSQPVSVDTRNGTDDAWQKMMSSGGEASVEVDILPEGDDLFLRGVDIHILSGDARGKKIRLKEIREERLIPGSSFGADDMGSVIASLQPGDELLLDNSDYIAIASYHRHQVTEDRSFPCFEQYRDENGTPVYPQRSSVISFGFTAGGCGSVQDGQIQGKVIIMNSLMDGDFPWQADWYKRLIERVHGDKAKDMVRLYYNDNAPHGDAAETGYEDRIVSYLGMLRQGLLDLAAWVEQGTEPAKESQYDLIDSQVVLRDGAADRGGLQPIVKLMAAETDCVRIRAGEKVDFSIVVELPDGAGTLERVEWNPYGLGFSDGETPCGLTRSFVYKKPGTYFASVRIQSNRQPGDAYTRLRNLARARIIVEE